MTTNLSAVDVAIVVLYLLSTTFLGAWFTRRQRDVRTYFVGDRDVSWWLVLISIVATETSTVTFLSVPGLAFHRDGGDLTFLQLPLGFIVGRLLIAWILLPQYLRGELFSAYQLLRERFNTAVQRTASGLFLATRVVADGLRLYLASLLLGQFTGWNTSYSILVIGFATIVYTYLGGMQAVIWTDLIQFVIYISGALLAAAIMLQRIPDGLDGFLAIGAAEHKLRAWDFAFDPTQPFNFWAGLIGGAFLTMASHGADQMMVQRYLCSRSLTQARVALVLSGLVVYLQFLLFLLIGVGLFVLYHLNMLDLTGVTKDDEVFGKFIVEYLPHGIVGLVIAAVLAASMSSLSSSLNSSASAFVADFYRPLRPDRTDRHYLGVSRLMTTLWGFTRIGVALAATQMEMKTSIIAPVLSVAGFTTGIILGLFLLGSMRRPVSSRAAALGLVVGFFVVLLIWVPSTRGHVLLAWPWYAPVGTVTTVVVALLLDALGRINGSPANGSPQPGLNESR